MKKTRVSVVACVWALGSAWGVRPAFASPPKTPILPRIECQNAKAEQRKVVLSFDALVEDKGIVAKIYRGSAEFSDGATALGRTLVRIEVAPIATRVETGTRYTLRDGGYVATLERIDATDKKPASWKGTFDAMGATAELVCRTWGRSSEH